MKNYRFKNLTASLVRKQRQILCSTNFCFCASNSMAYLHNWLYLAHFSDM